MCLALGCRVVRLWEHEVHENVRERVETIVLKLGVAAGEIGFADELSQ